MIVWLCLFAATPTDSLVHDQVDLIEVNHYHDARGRLVFDQVIFYEWDSASQRFQVRAWRLLKTDWQRPRRDWVRGGYVSSWRDGELWRQVRAANERKTWTTYDPEVLERNLLPIEGRRELTTRSQTAQSIE